MAINVLQNKFTAGEVSLKMLAQVDYDGYYKSARKIRNLLCLPQGGVKNRFGTNYIDVITDRTAGSTTYITDPDLLQVIRYDASPTEKFTLIIRPDTTSNTAADIYLGGVLLTSVGMPSYDAQLIADIRFIPGQRRLVLLHPSVSPQQLILGAVSNYWTFATVNFRQLPTYDYSAVDGTSYSSYTFTITATSGTALTDGTAITLSCNNAVFTLNHVGGAFYFNTGRLRINGFTNSQTVTGIVTVDFTGTSALSCPGQDSLLVETLWNNGGNDSNSPYYYQFNFTISNNNPTLPITVSSTVIVTATGGPSPGPFVSGLVGGTMMYAGGTITFTTYTSPTVMRGTVATAFNLPVSNSYVAPGAQCSFSETLLPGNNRGWPTAGVFYQGRLILGNNPANPNRCAASNTFDYYNFDDVGDEIQLDTDGFGFDVGSGGNEIIQSLVGNKSFVALGYNGPSASSLFEQVSMTPTSFYTTQQTNDGAAHIDPVIIDNQIIYIDANQQTVLSMTYDISYSGYFVTPINIINPEIVHQPTNAAAYRPNTNDGNFCLITNGDGTLAAFQTVLNENVRAWSLATTNGKFYNIDALKDEGSLLVGREILVSNATGNIDSAYAVDPSFDAFTPINVSGTGTAAVLQVADDYITLGCQIPTTKMAFVFNTPSSSNCTLVFQYFGSDGWTNLAVTDGTTGFTTNGTISWTAPLDWLSVNINHDFDDYYTPNNFYSIRIQRTATTVATTPVITSVMANVSNRIYYEQLSFNTYMDCSIVAIADSGGNVTGLNALAGQQVAAYVGLNPSAKGLQYVSISGTLALGPQAASAAVIIGIPAIPELVPMPIVAQLQTGWDVYEPKNVKYFYIDAYKSIGITLNGYPIQGQNVGDIFTQNPSIPETGFYKVQGQGGWDPRSDQIISQAYPGPMTILGTSFAIEV
jgi:hypothetical protein